MMHDHRLPYRWQDHAITPRRTAVNLAASALVAVVLGAAIFHASHARTNPAHLAVVPVATECTPSLARLAKRPALPRPISSWL
jgi:hypothetical protein